MKRVEFVALLGCLLLAVSGVIAASPSLSHRAAEHSAHLPSGSVALLALDPFLVAPNNLGDIGLSAFLGTNPNFATYSAVNIAADGVSAAIVVFQTASSSAVTFTVDGSATLLPYSDAYLAKAPAAGTQSLVVSGAGLRHIGAYYYAAALVQGPLGGYNTANTITVSAAQGSTDAQAELGLVVPPLVLAHGLWGDRGSLSNVEDYLDSVAPWRGQQQLVVPICYSMFLAFDARTDPLTNGKNPCEVTSQQALQTEVDSLLAELDNEHTVGGRVDIVAHSMGGLATRNYASQSAYASLRNRMQGQFHTIVTLDTPEAGSSLANFLVAHRNDTQKAPIWTFPGIVWAGVCGLSDVEACFAANDYPLSATTLPIDTGGVYSLEPKGPSLTNPNLVGPNIAHATWRAVSATKPGNGALNLALNTLIAALYAKPNSAPTLDSILKTTDNDAIVTVASQTQGANQSYTFPNLAHTSLVSSILTFLSGQHVNDNSVVDDPSTEVYQLAACWLASTGSSSCVPQETPENANPPAAQTFSPPRLVNRIRLHAPAAAELGIPIELAIHLLAPDPVSSVFVYQRGEEGRTHLEVVPITRVDNNTFYARVTPRFLGPVTFGIHADFRDGGLSVGTSSVYVAPPKYPPALSFRANDVPVLVLTLSGVTRTVMPHPLAVYAAPVGRVWLNSRFVTWRIEPGETTTAIALQPNGQIRALAPGETFVDAHFGASIDRLHVIVRATQQ